MEKKPEVEAKSVVLPSALAKNPSDFLTLAQADLVIERKTIEEIRNIDAELLGAVTYDDKTKKDTVTLNKAQTDGVKLTNVKDGTISTTSTDAVNGKQLFAVQTTATNALNLANNNKTEITNLTTNLNNGALGLVQDDKHTITVAKDSKTALVSLLGANNLERKLSGLADGLVTADSNDAVTGRQLHNLKAEIERYVTNNAGTTTDTTTGTTTGAAADPNMVKYDFGSNKEVLTLNADSTSGSGKGTRIKGVREGIDKEDAVNKGQLDVVQDAADKAQLTADNAKESIDKLKDGIDGLIGKNGLDGTNGTNGAVGAAGKDGLNGKDLVEKTNALRNGQAGTVVYTDNTGGRLARAEDGKFYAMKADGTADTGTAAVSDDKVRLSAVNANGLTTTPTLLSNLQDGLINKGSRDAVTGGQLHSTNEALKNLETQVLALASGTNNGGTGGTTHTTVAATDNAALKYDKDSNGNTDYSRATLGVNPDTGVKNDGVVLANVKGGKIEKGSQEAVTGGQLHNIVTSITGGDSEMVVNPDGTVSVNANYTVYNNDGTTSTVNNVSEVVNHINKSGTAYSQTNTELAPAVATGKETVAIGGGSQALGDGSVAIGSGSVARDPLEFSVGNSETGLTRRISNVSDGVNASDAATVGQVSRALSAVHGSLKQEIQQTRKVASQGIAASMAMNIDLPQQHPGEVAIGVGTAMYDGQSAVALGGNYLTNSGKLKISLGVGSSMGSGAKPAVKAGVGWVF